MAVRGDNSLYFSTGLDNSGLRQGADQAVGIITDLASTLGRINPFAALIAGAVASFAIISAEAHAMASDFEVAMAEVKTIANVSEEEFKDLEDSVYAVYRQLGTEPPDKLAKGLYEIIGAGFEAADALKVLEIASKAATAGVTTTEVAADGLTTILNAFQLSADNATEIADIMFATVDRGKISFEELSSQISTVAPLAAASGISFQEIGGALSTLTKQGVPASVAMTQIRSAIIATNEVMGDGVFDVYSLQEALNEMYKTAGGSQNELKNLAGRIEAVNGILALAGPNFKGATEDLNAMSDAAGSVDRSFNIITSTGTKHWEIFFNRLKASTRTLGENLLDLTSGLGKFLNEATEGTDQAIISLEKQRRQLLLNQDTLIDVNTSQEDRIKLIEDLQKKYPSYFADLKTEEISNDNIREAVKGINEELLNRIVLQEEVNSVAKAQEDVNERTILAAQADKALRLEIAQLAERYGLTLKDNLSLIERARDVSKQLPEEERVNLPSFGANIAQSGSASQRIAALINLLEGAKSRADEANEALTRMEERKREVEIILGINVDTDEIGDEIQKQLDIIANAKTNDELVPFLNSQNEQLKKAAEDRAKILKELFKPTGDGDRSPVDALGAEFLKDLGKTSQGLNLEFKLTADPTSIDYIDRVISQLRSKWSAANKDDRPFFENIIKVWEARLEEARKGLDKEEDLFKDADVKLENLSLNRLLKYRKEWNERLKIAKKGSDEERIILQNIDAASNEIGNKLGQSFGDISNALSSAESLFRKFGDETLANVLGQLGEIANAGSTIAQGVASQNPLQTAAGVIQAIDAVFSTGVSSNTGKFEKAVKDLERVIERLDYTIGKSIGEDRINNRQTAIERQVELQEELNNALEAEKAARKEIKYLGITVANKGRGSGTDQAKLDELQDKIEESKREAAELQEQLNELYTGTTHASIVDGIIAGLKEGKKSVADFADNFKDLMQDAMLQAFQTKYLDKALGDFYDQFAQAGSDSEYTPAEIASLQRLYNSIISGAQTDIDAINEILDGMGIGGIGSPPKQGLSGAISTITEDTANILAGTLNAIRLDVATGLGVAQQSSQYLSQIAQNTQYNRFLESIDNRIASIESGFLEIQAQG